ncbi:MAG TPA: tetratricopeptide repeat protein [Pseudolabrys sp.]|nr:tetratricopeptide repeat protein [Pseudolabrys sp.]
MTSLSLARCTLGTALAAFLAAAPTALYAQGPTVLDLAGMTSSGSYLAARHAGQMREASAAAAYYRAALKYDPKNTDLLDRTFLSLVVGGDIDEAVRYAERIAQADKNDRVAQLVLGVHLFKQKQYTAARRNLAQSIRGPITDLTATLLTAWSFAGAGDAKSAIAAIDRLSGPDWYAIFKELHAGMILDFTGNQAEAGKRFEHAYKLDPTALRVVQAYGSWLSRNGKVDEARKVFTDFNKALPNHPLIIQGLKELASTSKKAEADSKAAPKTAAKHNARSAKAEIAHAAAAGLPRIVDTPQAGAAEALYGLGASLGRRGGEDLGLVYLQLALALEPNHPLALLSLADLYESLKKPDLAIKAYEHVPANSPLHRNAAIQMATNLDSLDRSAEAEQHLNALIKEHPDDLEAIVALGNVLRGHKKFAECADVYSKAVALVPHPEKANWVLFYFRGICFERAHQWPKAEADLQEALKLFPEQPHVLNYLGYSWVDQGVRLDEGMDMIKRAVQQRPDDGYIVDSLGWAYYRIGNYEEAVKQLDRAIELKPEDPTINDHLGDAYWRVGRTLEAHFQWAHARDLKPDPEDLPKIEAKLKNGLPDETSSQAKAGKKSGDGG